MNEILPLALQNFLSPAILFFILGIAAGLVKSDLELPESISRYLSLYLMMAIGFKGGASLASQDTMDLTGISVMAAGAFFSLLWPYFAYWLARQMTRTDRFNAAVIAAHYGSVSVVTFATAISFLSSNHLNHEGYLVAVLALMEAPAIFSGLYLAQRARGKAHKEAAITPDIFFHAFTNGAVFLLLGSFTIGFLSYPSGYEKMENLLITPFQGVLALFLLDLGLLVARHLHHLKGFSPALVVYGIVMPLLGAAVGLGLSWLIGLDVGTGFIFMALTASASYIAVPAAMRLAVPEANPGIYIPLALAITFPFNIVLGLPLYFEAAKVVLQGLRIAA